MHPTARLVAWLSAGLCMACNSSAMQVSGDSTPPPSFVNCSPSVDYDWGQEAVRFFQAHPM